MSMQVSKMVGFCISRCYNRLLVPAVRSINRSIHTFADVQYRSMKEEDFPKINQLLDKEKWVMEKAYLECAFATDPRGFTVAETTDEKIIGIFGSLPLSESLHTLGLWLVKKEYRSSGVGPELVKRTTKCVNQNLAMFSWPHNQHQTEEILERTVTQTYTTWYNYGQINHITVFKNKQTIEHKEPAAILPLKHASISDIIQYDTQIHKVPRQSYIKHWISHEKSKTYVAVKDDTVCGYAVLRSQDDFNQIAPLYADNWYVANQLFLRLASEVPKGCNISFTSPLENNAATRLADRYRLMKRGMPMLMMFTNEPIFIDMNRVYALSSTSFGLC